MNDVLVWYLLCFALITCTAFAVGRRIGRVEGRQRVGVEMPIQLRVSALETGTCPICGSANERELH